MKSTLVTGLAGLLLAAASAVGDVINLDLGPEIPGVISGVGPQTGMLTFDADGDALPAQTLELRLFNTISQTAGSVSDPNNAIDGDAFTFARVGGASAGMPGCNDMIEGALELTFDNGFTFTKANTIVFTEFGSEDEPFSISIEIGDMLFEISSSIAGTADGVTETELLANQKYRVFELDLSGDYFAALPDGVFNTFTITDETGITNLSPDVNFAGVVVPMPTPLTLAGVGLLAGAGWRRRR
jgi:hypothetical protein